MIPRPSPSVVPSLAFLLSLPVAARSGTQGISGSLEVGFDSFTEKYSIVEEDTVDNVTEFRTLLHLGYRRGSSSKDYFRVEGRGLIGNSTVEGAGRVNLVSSLSSFQFGLSGDIGIKAFRENSSYAYANNFTKQNLVAFIKKDLNSRLSFRLGENMERIDFDKRTDFDYDYIKHKIMLAADYEWNFSAFLHGGVGFTQKSIPDTSSISYKSYAGILEFRKTFGALKELFFTASTERRIYGHKPTKSPYWSLITTAKVQPVSIGSFSFLLESSLESYAYDYNSEVYFDYLEDKTAILLSYYPSFTFRVGLGPTFAFFRSDFSEEDRYKEHGARLEIEISRIGRVWISSNYEVGKRYYSFYQTHELESVFSDYTFNRILLFAAIKAWGNLSLNGFLNYDPEKHKRVGDNSSTTLFSVDLSYNF